MIYKTLKKVSDYCQLLDKSKYPGTVEIAGINFTNNGDGSFTMTGTKSGNAQLKICVADIKEGHKYLGTTGTNIFYMWFYKDGESFYGDLGRNPFYTATKTGTDIEFYIKTDSSDEVNVTAYPQLFDLTEMYGAGNEPTTVEQFRQDFPEELYDYKPYCFVKSYKTLLKASDVCQLLDKRKFLATQTINGVTFTNNGDGTITVNGTATSTAFFLLFKYLDSLMPKHKYLLSGSPNDASVNAYIQCYDDTNFEWLRDVGGGAIAIFPKQVVNLSGANNIRIRIAGGYTVNNIIFKPQLFDLTEMYGVGNEPTTVEEFREKFSNELYDYKPYSIITSYKKSLVCKTKNLFDNIPVKINYIISSNGEEVASPGFNIYGKIYGNNFTISINAPVDLTNSDNWLRVCLYNSAGTFITRRDFDFNTRTVANIADDNIDYIQLCFSRTSFPNYKLQVELGSTPTEYHPYGYL